ncbi:hypothetical protein QQ045_024052 [Rhodiola kirilowii]
MGSKTWFDNYLTNMPDDVDEETLKKYARAYILLGLTLMSDLYGDQLERMVHGDFIFRPYEEELMDRLHPVCLESRELWTTDVPLICFNIVEWHHLIRVMRQFGWKQIIPPALIAFTNEHHGLERKKRVDWRMHLHQYVALWSSRYERLIYGDPGEDAEDIDIPSDEYVYWYSRITRRLIQPKLEEEDTQAYRPSAHQLPSNICMLLICASHAANGFSSTTDPRLIFHRIFHSVVEELRVLGELRLLNINPDIIQFGNGDDDDMSLDDDHVTNLDSQTAGYDRPSSSRAPPSPPFRPSTSHAPPSPPFQSSTSQAPQSPPAHGHQLHPQKSPKQSWLKTLRRQRFGRD